MVSTGQTKVPSGLNLSAASPPLPPTIDFRTAVKITCASE